VLNLSKKRALVQHFAKMTDKILGRFKFLTVTGGDERFTVGAERDTMTVMPFSSNFWFLDSLFFH
jgi:hypothetical protein